MDIELKPVTDRQILAIGFDEPSSTLAIRFKGFKDRPPSIYHYANVTKDLFMELATADSIYSAFYAKLKYNTEKYPFQRIE